MEAVEKTSSSFDEAEVHNEEDFFVVQENILTDDPIDQDEENLGGFAPTFNPDEYESHEMKRLIAMHAPDEILPPGLDNISYKPADIFPDWILQNSLWKNAPKKVESNEISEILNVPVSKRTQEQVSTLIHWLMSVWQTANQMGFKRCGSMFKEFNYNIFQPGDNIITEGERGLTFYIIISGMTVVSKEGIGIVGQLGKGKSFGEIALTQGKDLRTATVTAQTRVEVLSLHKQNYDIFVRDILEMERRENFQLLANCSLFKNWAKGKIEKMCNTCTRRSYEDGQYIFRQGDPPGDLMIIVEGGISIFKELVIITKNRWPVGLNEWKERVRRITKPIMLKTLGRGEYFGEIAILKNIPRSTSAIAQGRCVLLCIDKAEFLFLLNLSTLPIKSLKDEQAVLTENLSKYYDDMQVMETVQHIKGGPQSMAYVGQLRAGKATIDGKVIKEYARDSEDIEIIKPSTIPAGISITDDAWSSRPGTAYSGGNSPAIPQTHKKRVQIGYPKSLSRTPHNTATFSPQPVRPGTTGSMRSRPSASINTNNNNNSLHDKNHSLAHTNRPSTATTSTAGATDGTFEANVDPMYLRVTRRQSVAEQIRSAVMDAKVVKQRTLANRKMDYAKVFDKQYQQERIACPKHFLGTSAAATHLLHTQASLPLTGAMIPTVGNGARTHLRSQTQQILREKLDAHQSQRRGSIVFHATSQSAGILPTSSPSYQNPQHYQSPPSNFIGMSAAAAMAAATVGLAPINANTSSSNNVRSGSILIDSPVMHTRRVSLQGLDNDASTTYAFDSNKVVMRRNSVIRLGQVYEHVYQRIQLEAAAESAASAAAAAMFGGGGGGANNSPSRKRSTASPSGNTGVPLVHRKPNHLPNTPHNHTGTSTSMSPMRRTLSSTTNNHQQRTPTRTHSPSLPRMGTHSGLVEEENSGEIVGRVPFAIATSGRPGRSSQGADGDANYAGADGRPDLRIRRPNRRGSVGVFEPYKEATAPILQEVLQEVAGVSTVTPKMTRALSFIVQ